VLERLRPRRINLRQDPVLRLWIRSRKLHMPGHHRVVLASRRCTQFNPRDASWSRRMISPTPRHGLTPLTLRVVAFAVLALIAVACSGSVQHGSVAGSGPPPATSSASQSSPATGGCTTGEVHSLVTGFIEAFNTGDEQALQRLFAQAGQGFFWYSTDSPGQRFNQAADDRGRLMTYFVQRHAAHESLHLSSFKFNGNSASMGDFEYTLTRTADHLPATPYVGKGSAVCTAYPRTIGVWSMARDPSRS